MSASSILLGAVLTFGSTDGRTLQLTVSLTESATVSLTYNGARRTSPAGTRHRFTHLPSPTTRAATYVLGVAGEAPRTTTIKPLFGPGPLRVGLYGDSRDGPGPHQILLRALDAADPHVVVHTGDVVSTAHDQEGWVQHLAASLPLSSRVPVILSLGNHELWQPWDLPADRKIDALAAAMEHIPPPLDALSQKHGTSRATFHVRVGPALFASLDSNTSLKAGEAQMKWLEAVLEGKGDARFIFLSMHHGPLSSGRHGGHRDGGKIIELARRFGVTGVLSGHDHTYERIEDSGVTYLVSGGGGAPLYERRRLVEGSKTFASTYNWALITLEGEQAKMEAFSLEGVVLDRATLGRGQQGEAAPSGPRSGFALAGAGAVLLGLLLVLGRMIRGRRAA